MTRINTGPTKPGLIKPRPAMTGLLDRRGFMATTAATAWLRQLRA